MVVDPLWAINIAYVFTRKWPGKQRVVALFRQSYDRGRRFYKHQYKWLGSVRNLVKMYDKTFERRKGY